MGELGSNILFIIGIGIFGGIAGAWFFQKIKVPQVLGYLAIGILLGKSGLKIINGDIITSLDTFNFFALGIIGFMVGGELHGSTMKKYGKQFSAIVIGEGVLAFILVSIATGLIIYMFTGSFAASLAAGIVFGAIASATDPASTINVLWEYRAKGVLTTTIIATVALDDALAMTLYGLGTGAAQIILGGNASISDQLIKISIELFGAVILGGLAGVFMNLIVRYSSDKTRTMVFGLGTLLILIAVAMLIDVDVILASMTMGIVVTNMAPERSKSFFELIKSFSSPIYVLFFVLVGARLTLGGMPAFVWVIVGAYVLFRSLGKMTGAWMGAKFTHADKVVQKYTGFGLFTQGGVAIGLSIMATQHLHGLTLKGGYDLGDVIITGVTATTFIVQIIGPPMTKLAIKLSDEAGKNITEEDITARWKVADAVTENVPVISITDSVKKIVSVFSESDFFCLPVVDKNNKTVGMITMNDLRELMVSQDTWEWILAGDIISPAPEVITRDEPLDDALKVMKQLGREQLPVIESENNPVPVGILDTRAVRKKVNKEIVGAA